MAGSVVVTGASRGIGRAIALELARGGHPVIAAARSKEELDALAREIRETLKGSCTPVVCDLATPEGRRTLEAAADAGGPLTGLVNNAGFGTAGYFEKTDRVRDIEMLRLNVEALTDLCHAFIPRVKGQPGAFIINVASTAAFQPVPTFAAYAATKAYVLSLSEALAEELEPQGVHVMALCPGVTETSFQSVADVVLPGKAPTAGEVAKYALKALAARKVVAVHGGRNALLAFSTRLAPRRFVARSSQKVMEPWFKARK